MSFWPDIKTQTESRGVCRRSLWPSPLLLDIPESQIRAQSLTYNVQTKTITFPQVEDISPIVVLWNERK